MDCFTSVIMLAIIEISNRTEQTRVRSAINEPRFENEVWSRLNQSVAPTSVIQSTTVVETKPQSLEKVATVTLCLCDHDKCTGQYVDYTKTYIVECACGCHNNNNNYNSGLKGDK